MNPEIIRALNDGVPPQAIIAELQRLGKPVPVQLTLMATRPDAGRARAPTPTPTAVPPTLAGVMAGVLGAGTVGSVAGGAAAAAGAGIDHFANKQLREAIHEAGGPETLLGRLDELDATGRGAQANLQDLHPSLTAQADFVATNDVPSRVKLTRLNEARRRGAPDRLIADAEQLAPGGYSAPKMMGDITNESQQDFAASEHGFEGLRQRNPTLPPKAIREMYEFTQDPAIARHWNDAARTGLIPPMPTDAPTSFAVVQGMKESLDGAVGQAFRSGNRDLGVKLAAARDRVVRIMSDYVPGYREVAAQYAVMAKRKEALLRGEAAWHEQMQLPDLERELADLSPEELKAYRQGVLGGYLKDVENAGTNRNFAMQMEARSAVTARKLELIFGGKDAFLRAAGQAMRYKQEVAMARLGGAVGGSQTARRISAQGTAAADAMEVGGEAAHAIIHPITGVPMAAKSMVSRFLPGAVARRLSPAFMTEGSEGLRAFLRSLPR